MVKVNLNEVSVSIPVFNSSSRSITSKLLNVATGGSINASNPKQLYIEALQNISLSAEPGDRIALLGHNGAGKSTLLRVLGRVYAPTSGQALIRGKIGSLIDISLGINPEATGKENIFLRGALMGLTKIQIQKKFDEIVNFSDLGNFINMPVRTYSSGMHLRLAFSVSTIIEPEILLMDEWLSVGDENFRQKAENRLVEMVTNTEVVFLATHSIDLALNTCNKAIWLEHGRIKEAGLVSDVAANYHTGN